MPLAALKVGVCSDVELSKNLDAQTRNESENFVESIKTPDFGRGIDGLLPAIAQHVATGRVLMLAWMNETAFQQTVETGFAVYYSRSRRKLWKKGESSGHLQRVIEIAVDCDADAVLLKVEQVGAACHEGYASCFFRTWDGERFDAAEERLRAPAEIYGDDSVSGN